MKLKSTKQKGITLIALVLTVIILLILAAITLNIVLGENGIISKTQEGKLGTEISREKEILQMSLSGIQASHEGNLTFDETELLNQLKGYTESVEVTKSGNSMYIVKYTDTNREYEVYSNGKIDDATEKAIDENPGEFEGEGTEENPYLIQSIEDLVALSNNVNAGESYEGKYFNIENNLNFASRNSYVDPDRTDYGDVNGNGTTETLITELTTEAGFTPIGTSSSTFKGNVNGKGNTISNLYINNQDYFVGLFGFIEGNNIFENIDLKDIEISNSKGSTYVGALIGRSESTTLNIENCTTSGKIESNGYAGGFLGYIMRNTTLLNIEDCINNVEISGEHSGGILAFLDVGAETKISNCINNAKITAKSKYSNYAGGIVACANNSTEEKELVISNCYNTGTVESNGNKGGIIGHSNQKITINNCYNTGKVTGDKGTYVGGIIGRGPDYFNITNSYNAGEITGKGSYVGGILGRNEGSNGSIIKCYNIGKIDCDSVYSSIYIGGIVGNVYSNTMIDQCYNKGNIIGKTSNITIGGIAGSISRITNCYNFGEIEITDKSNSIKVGGIVGQFYSDRNCIIENCYNVGEINYSGDNANVQSTYIGGIIGDFSNSSSENAKNLYSIGKLTNIPTNTLTGATIGYKNGAIENIYYLKGVYSVAYGKENESTTTIAEEVENLETMKTIMNTNLANLEGWSEDLNNDNDGYPTLQF